MSEEIKREKSAMELWAENEVAIACQRENPNRKEGEFDYGCACYESALKAFRSLCADNHSGMSIGFTKAILNRLIDGKPLMPIDDIDNIWNEVEGRDDGSKHYQCKRMFSLFKTVKPDGTVEYSDVDRFHGINIKNPDYAYHSGLIDTVMKELFPIKMPYIPFDKASKVYTEDFLVDPKNGDYDTVGILFVVIPQGEKVEINRFFKEAPQGFDEIDEKEYLERKEAAKARLKKAGNDNA